MLKPRIEKVDVSLLPEPATISRKAVPHDRRAAVADLCKIVCTGQCN